MKRRYVAAAAIVSMAFLPACNDDGNDAPIELPMPMFFEFNATASAEEGDLTVNCSIGFVVEISGKWLCAPLDVEQGGINDDSVFAEGTWTTTEIVEAQR